MLKAGCKWLASQRSAHAGTRVTYSDGDHSIELLAVVAASEFEQAETDGLISRLQTRDYIIEAEALAVAGDQIEPQAGHRIREADGPVVRVFEVVSPGSEPPWRWSDPYHQSLRIHTIAMGTE